MKRTDRCRPIVGGISCGSAIVTAGTLGAFIWLDDKPYLISNAHVFEGKVGDPILQPGSFDGGETPADVVAELAFISEFEETNKVDLGIAEAVVDVKDEILEITPGSRQVDLVPYEPAYGAGVLKSGRTTGLSVGKVTAQSTHVSVAGYQAGTILFEDVVAVDGKCGGGDSGSAVIDMVSGNLIGLLFAGTEDGKTFFVIKAKNILDALQKSPKFRPALTQAVEEPPKLVIPILAGLSLVGGGLALGLRR